MLVRYIRKADVCDYREELEFYGHRVPVGVMVAINQNGKIRVGYSLCGRHDQFNKEMGKRIAEGRALKKPFDQILAVCPEKIMDNLFRFGARALKYYNKQQPGANFDQEIPLVTAIATQQKTTLQDDLKELEELTNKLDEELVSQVQKMFRQNPPQS
jgi:hypothetical protein